MTVDIAKQRERWRRARAKAYRKQKAAAATRRTLRAREAELRERSLVAMGLTEDLVFADHEHKRGETIWVVPGLVWQWEKRQLAVEIPRLESYAIRVITGPPPDRFESPEVEPRRRETAAGY